MSDDPIFNPPVAKAPTCPECSSTQVERRVQGVELESGGKFSAEVFICATCGTSWISGQRSIENAAAAAVARGPRQKDLDWLASLTPEEKKQVEYIFYLTKRAFPNQRKAQAFLFGPCVHLGGQEPGEMVNTQEGRDELQDFLILCLAMQCEECKGIGPKDHEPTCSREKG